MISRLIIRLIIGLIALQSWCFAQEWNFEQDFACRLFGCAVVYDGQEALIYLLNGMSGSPAQLYDGTGLPLTLSAKQADGEPGGQVMMGIDTDGDGKADIRAFDRNQSGFLDAGDALPRIPLTAMTGIAFESSEMRRSFFAASNAPFALHAYLPDVKTSGDIGDYITLSDIKFELNLFTPPKTQPDNGYGSQSAGGGFRPEPGIKTLADIQGAPARLGVFQTGTAVLPGAGLRESSVMLVSRYGIPRYDLTKGFGGISAQINFLVYNP